MVNALRFLCVAVFFILLAGCGSTPDQPAETRPVGTPILAPAELAKARSQPDFRKHVQPILKERCLDCHDGKEMPGKLNLSSRTAALSAPGVIVPGDPDSSMLIAALTTGNHAMSMPAVGAAVPPEEIEVLKQWIALGAKWPE